MPRYGCGVWMGGWGEGRKPYGFWGGEVKCNLGKKDPPTYPPTHPPQLAICKAVEECDGGATFHKDAWVREDGGGGISMVLKDGKVWYVRPSEFIHPPTHPPTHPLICLPILPLSTHQPTHPPTHPLQSNREKAGCNLSVVYGSMPQEALQAATERGVDRAKGMKPGTLGGWVGGRSRW